MPLVMRLETAAVKFDRLVKPTEKFEYDFDAADMRDLLREAATRIKVLEHACYVPNKTLVPCETGQLCR